MEFIHSAALISQWLDKLAPQTRYYVMEALVVLTVVMLVWLLYVVVRQERVSESGQVVVHWYHPLQWLARYKQLKAENEAKLSPDARSFVEKVQQFISVANKLKSVMYDVIFVVVGLLGLLGVLICLPSPIATWWMLIPSVVAVYIGYEGLRKLINAFNQSAK